MLNKRSLMYATIGRCWWDFGGVGLFWIATVDIPAVARTWLQKLPNVSSNSSKFSLYHAENNLLRQSWSWNPGDKSWDGCSGGSMGWLSEIITSIRRSFKNHGGPSPPPPFRNIAPAQVSAVAELSWCHFCIISYVWRRIYDFFLKFRVTAPLPARSRTTKMGLVAAPRSVWNA